MNFFKKKTPSRLLIQSTVIPKMWMPKPSNFDIDRNIVYTLHYIFWRRVIKIELNKLTTK